jgi:hypothetical protein
MSCLIDVGSMICVSASSGCNRADTGGPTHPACMQHLIKCPNQAAVVQLVHLESL